MILTHRVQLCLGQAFSVDFCYAPLRGVI